MAQTTRSAVTNDVFGTLRRIGEKQLPTKWDVEKHLLLAETETSKVSVKDIAKDLGNELQKLWEKASVPCVHLTRISQLILDNHSKYKTFLKNKGKECYNKQLESYKNLMQKDLFDISCCKCKSFEECKCTKNRKVPVSERQFLSDQRGLRHMYIGKVDAHATKILVQREKRKRDAEKYTVNACHNIGQESESKIDVMSDTDDSFEDDGKDETYHPPNLEKDKKKVKVPRMQISCDLVAREADRFGVSDRGAAAIATSVLVGAGLVSPENKNLVVDKSKLRRARKSERAKLQQKEKEDIIALYFDGRKDKTLTLEERRDDKGCLSIHQVTKFEEHISLVKEPGSEYIDHVTPDGGTAAAISACMMNSGLITETLLAVGCDGTPVNTGTNGGAIKLIEDSLNRPLQWLICMLHFNELPFRHIFKQLDGESAGPKAFKGKIGKKIGESVSVLPVVNFAPIPVDDVEKVYKQYTGLDLSKDQKYILNIWYAVSSGKFPPSLSSVEPGPLAHSRWLTACARILRLYCSVPLPSKPLKTLVKYLMTVYIPIWFEMKKNPSCVKGPKHLFSTITKMRYLKNECLGAYQAAAQAIQTNAFYAHPENMLLAMAFDEDVDLRRDAVNNILAARNNPRQERRQFKVPKINFEADRYTHMIKWDVADITEPPILRHLSDDELQSLAESPDLVEKWCPKYPCHTQSVERTVKLVTEASAKVYDYKNRDGYIRNTLKSRKIMPAFESKKDFKAK